jgi:CDGSH-type Zn-finger protein
MSVSGKIKIAEDGPYLVSGKISLEKEIIIRDDAGFSVEYEKGEKIEIKDEYALCRCGNSKSKPFCDGSHVSGKFDGKETASRKKYLEEAHTIKGPDLDLTDKEELCFGAGFCHNKRGDVWNLTRQSNFKEAKDLAIKEACNCPSGRLVAWDKKTGKAIEPKFSQSISLIEEPDKKVSGPIWVKGNIEIESSDGKLYEKRNRVTLCRCGQSENKPFCDGNHVPAGFSDGDASLLRKRQRKNI